MLQKVLLYGVLLFICCNCEKAEPYDQYSIVQNGHPILTISKENKWQSQDNFLVSGDPFDELYPELYLTEGDFESKTRLSLERIDSSTALFLFFGHHFGFDSKPDGSDNGGQLFFYNPGDDKLKKLGPAQDFIQPGEPFDFGFKRRNGQFEVWINEQSVLTMDTSDFQLPLEGFLAFRPGENVMRIYDWEIKGETRPLPPLDFIFQAGEANYVCFRIPAIFKAQNGDLLAFAEARKDNCWTDGRDIDLVMKRSTDGGKSWGAVQVVWDDGPNTCAYPTPVLEENTGRIYLFACHNLGVDLVGDITSGNSLGRRSIFVLHSDDHGQSWTVPKNETTALMSDHWSWVGTGPGKGTQLKGGPHQGRLLIPAHHKEFETNLYYAHAIISDDFGKTWRLGQATSTIGGNECQIVEFPDGRVMMNMRNYNKSAPNQRQIAISRDGGESWGPSWFDSTLVDPPCQGSLLFLEHKKAPKGILLFANPPYISKRADLTLRASLDEGQTWPYQKQIFEGATAYSDLIQLDSLTIGVLYESGHPFPYQGLTFEKIVLSEWLDL